MRALFIAVAIFSAADLWAAAGLGTDLQKVQVVDSGTTTYSVRGVGAVVAESIAVRCVNGAGSGFESCAGAGGGGAAVQDVNIISTFSATNPGHVVAAQKGPYVVTQGTGTFRVEITGADLSLAGRRFISESGVQTKVATAEEAFLLLRNPGASGRNLFMDLGRYQSIDIGINFIFRMRRSPVITSTGTALGINNLLISSPTASSMQVFLKPTTSDLGTLVKLFQVKDQPVDDTVNGRIVLPPGRDLLITIAEGSNGKLYAAGITWWEEPLP